MQPTQLLDSAGPSKEDSTQICDFVRQLTNDGLAAIELLGELPPEGIRSGTRIRIPSNFPIPEDLREDFYTRAQDIGLLRAVGPNHVHGVLSQVWELDIRVYELVLDAMTTSGSAASSIVNYQNDGPAEQAVPEGIEFGSGPTTTTPEAQLTIPELRELASAARGRRAAARAQSEELSGQYRTTLTAIADTVRSLTELRARLAGLHEHRISLKRRVKSSNIEYHQACREAKQRAHQLALAERESLDTLASTAAELLLDEAQRLGVSPEQALALIRKKLTAPQS